MARHIKTRDYAMVLLINGATKAGAHRDNRKHANAYACRGKEKMIAAKKKAVRSFDWTRPALHGDELFEICLDEHSNIIEAYLIDEDDNAIHFNLSSFNEDEMAQIRELALAN
jgi:hypothetical protein